MNSKQEISTYARSTVFYWCAHLRYLPRNPPRTSRCLLTSTTFFFFLTKCKRYRPYTRRLDKINARRLQFSPGSTLYTVRKCINSGTRSRRASGETGINHRWRTDQHWGINHRWRTGQHWVINQQWGGETPHEHNYSHWLFQLPKWSRTERKKEVKKKSRRSATNNNRSVKLLKLRKWTPSHRRKSVLCSTRLSCWKHRHYICIDTAGGRGL